MSELAGQISKDYAATTELTMVGVLKGAFIFIADLSRRLTVPRTVDFIAVASYGKRGTKSGAVRLLMDLRESIEDKDVLVVEKDVPAATRDGVTLFADVYWPEADGRFPVLLSCAHPQICLIFP